MLDVASPCLLCAEVGAKVALSGGSWQSGFTAGSSFPSPVEEDDDSTSTTSDFVVWLMFSDDWPLSCSELLFAVVDICN